MHLRILMALALASGLSSAAWAQVVQVVTDCAGVSAPVGPGSRLFTDQTGRLCVSGAAGSTTLRTAGTNRSMSVATTATTLMAANASRQGWKIKNDCVNAIWINHDGAASAVPGGGNIKMPPGAFMASGSGIVETGAISAIAETGACDITAREY